MSEFKFDIGRAVSLLRSTNVFDVNYYLHENPDVNKAGLDPINHYVTIGELEGRKPNRLFDPKWYKEQYRLDSKKVNLFLHYLGRGDLMGFKPSAFFDPVFIRTHYNLSSDEFAFYFFAKNHQALGINPNKYFNTDHYLEMYPYVVGSEVAPYIHFIEYGVHDGLLPMSNFDWSYVRFAHSLSGSNSEIYGKLCAYGEILGWKTTGNTVVADLQNQIKNNQMHGEFYEKFQMKFNGSNRTRAEVFAFYLPQFHNEEKNNKWWGSGFTEWTNLSRGVPRYKGHYQPRVPADLGYYSLDDVNIVRRQVQMAKDSGISGFSIYYYDFGEADVLRKPLRLLRENADIQIEYFLIWANETWSRRWDGSEEDVLLLQEYPKGFEKKLAIDFSDYFRDPRYKKINDRPLLVIYRPKHIPHSKKFIKNLRREFNSREFNPEIYIAQSFGDEDPKPYGADGAMEFPPHKLAAKARLITGEKILYNKNNELRIYSYDDFVSISLSEEQPEYPLIKTAFPSWDNDARKQGNSTVVDGANPKKFEFWIRKLLQADAIQKNGNAIVCVNAWNEWGEGAYLEPDRHMGFANLNAIARALSSCKQYRKKTIVLVGSDLRHNNGAHRLLLQIGRRFKSNGCEVIFVFDDGTSANEDLKAHYKGVGELWMMSEMVSQDKINNFHDFLASKNVDGYLFNSTLSTACVKYLPEIGCKRSVLLVHEMSGKLNASCNPSQVKEILPKLSGLVFPAEIVSAQFEAFTGQVVKNKTILSRGICKNKDDFLPYSDNKVNFHKFFGERRDALVVVCIGFGDWVKGFDLFISVCAELCRIGKDVIFIWQGDVQVSYQVKLNEEAAKLILNKNLLVVPFNENIGNVMSVADVYFLSSREDAFPSAAIEAWSFGLPVVTFAGTGGVAETIQLDPKLGHVIVGTSISDATQFFAQTSSKPTELDDFSIDAEYRKAFVFENQNFTKYCKCISNLLAIETNVDVCIFVKNETDYVRRCLSSVLSQTTAMNTIRVLNACADDGADSTLKAIVSEHTVHIDISDLSKSRRNLLELFHNALNNATSEFLWLTESEDDSSPIFLDRAIEELKKNSEIGFVFSGVDEIYDSKESSSIDMSTHVERIMGNRWSKGGVFDGSDFLSSGAAIANPIVCLGSVVWRRAAFQQALEVFEHLERASSIKFAHDWLMYICVAARNWKVAYIPEVLSRHYFVEKLAGSSIDLAAGFFDLKEVYQLIDRVVSIDSNRKRDVYLKELTVIRSIQ